MFKKIINRLYRHKENITAREMLEIIKTNENAVLLDVRSPQEYREGHISGSINVSVYDLEKKILTQIPNKENIIIVYCSAGVRSRKAIQILRKLGYKNLYNIEGGIENI